MAGTVESVEQDLERIRERDPELASSSMAAVALALAARIDDPGSSTTSISLAAGTLLGAMERLRELSPPAARSDSIDELNRVREKRRRAPRKKTA